MTNGLTLQCQSLKWWNIMRKILLPMVEKGKTLSKICGVPPALHKSDSPLQYYLPVSSWNTLLRGLGLSCRELIINEVKTKPNWLQTPQCMTDAPDPRDSSPLWLPWLPGCLETPVGGAVFCSPLQDWTKAAGRLQPLPTRHTEVVTQHPSLPGGPLLRAPAPLGSMESWLMHTTDS